MVCTEQPQFKTECELIWIKLDIVGTQPLYIAAFYKPKEDDLDSLEKLKDSLDMLVEKKGTIMVLGDFNLPKLSWIDHEPSPRQDCVHRPVYECFTDILDDFNLTQMVTQPTRQDHVLDLFLISNPTLVTDITILPGLGDHDIVQAEVAVKPTQVNPKRRKADWTTFRSKLKAYQTEFL